MDRRQHVLSRQIAVAVLGQFAIPDTDFFIVRRRRIDVDELYQEPQRSIYGDVNWAGIVAFLVGLVAGWSVEDGLVPALQGPISTKLLGGADLSWLAGIVVAGALYLALS